MNGQVHRLLNGSKSLSIGTRSFRTSARDVLKEAVLLGVVFAVYYCVRLLVRDAGTEPLQNAVALFLAEADLNLDWERALQRAFLEHMRPVVHVLNFVYAWGYWLILAGSLGYLYLRRRDIYCILRNAIIISGLIGFLVFASFPLAPPRLAPTGIVDTAGLSLSALEEVIRPSALTNENAAMPSFHFGWVLLCGVCLSMAVKRWVGQALMIALPLLMGLTIIVTGNHYVLDAIVGGAVSLLGLVPSTLRRRSTHGGRHQLQHV